MGIYHGNGMNMLCYIQYSTYQIHFLFVVKDCIISGSVVGIIVGVFLFVSLFYC